MPLIDITSNIFTALTKDGCNGRTEFYKKENLIVIGLVNELKPLFSEMPVRFDYKCNFI
jgi:predicted nucleic-acid-binding Zn-ribbon protein